MFGVWGMKDNIIFRCLSGNAKRYTALACIILFFTVSTSFSYPAMSANISFESAKEEAIQEPPKEIVSEVEVAESEAELAAVEDVDQAVMEEVSEKVNPDAAEIDNMVSVTEILDTAQEADSEATAETAEEISEETSGETTTESSEAISEEASTEPSVEQTDKKEQILQADEKLPEETTKPDSADQDESFKSDDWNILLVNKQHPIPDDYEFTLGTISGNMKCDERMITPLFDMLRAAKDDGVNLIVCSPYRDMDRQTMLFSNKIKRYMEGGMSYMDAYTTASQAVTVPGSSEHQIGLAVDIITTGYTLLDEGFGDTAAGKWLAENSSRYGFILRYPAGKEEITSIEYERWHFRYVGTDAASVIADNGLCLEEFWNIYVE